MTQNNIDLRDEEKFLDTIFELDQLSDLENIDIPEALENKLLQIPKQQPKSFFLRSAFATAASVLFGTVILFSMHEPHNINELELARQELSIAFQYIDRTQQEIEPRITTTLRENLQRSTIEPVFESAANVQF